MRSFSITALMLVVAFTLGLALGGQIPRTAAAASDSVTWKTDGDTLVFTNETVDQGHLALGTYTPGWIAPVAPAQTDGLLEVAAAHLDELTVFRLEPVITCAGTNCRPCGGLIHCPVPAWPPIGDTVRSVIAPHP